MHLLFVHQNFPAQFGHLAQYLAVEHGHQCTFVSRQPARQVGPIECVQYQVRGGASRHNHFCSRSFENVVWHSHAVHEALQARPDLQPDLIVGHSGFGSTLFLRELYDCPIINYFEYFYHAHDSDLDFRPEASVSELVRLRARCRNAALLLDLDHCDAGYSPTAWQRNRLPIQYQDKVRVLFDGIDTNVWRRQSDVPRRIQGQTIPADMKIVTYVARGLEAMRGFDIFMKMAKKLCDRRPDVLFVVVGEERSCYGNEEACTDGKSFKDWVLAQDDYDHSRFRFLGRVPPTELARLLSLSDLHIYLTVPFVLSWSLMNALACGATVLASDTAPVQEMIVHGQNGLLTDFFDVEALAAQASTVLDQPEAYRHLGQAGREMVEQHYSLEACEGQFLDFFQEVLQNAHAPVVAAAG